MYPLRAWFKNEVLAEFFPPYLGAEGKFSSKVIIFCGGAPSAPDYSEVLKYWSRKGYWVFNPRYRGTWESRGVFMEKDPTIDILDLIDELNKPLLDQWTQVEYSIDDFAKGGYCYGEKEIFIIGSSFGGPAAVFSSKDKRVKKVVLRSPVIDWRAPSKDEPLEHWPEVVERSFGQAYRSTPDIWGKLQSGKFYNPMLHLDEFDGSKIMIIHAEDDMDTRAKEVHKFADKTKSKLYMLKKGGHIPVSLTSWKWARKIEKFFK